MLILGSANVTAGTPKGNVDIRKGVADLRNQSFDKTVSLKGEWAFAWKKLLVPNQFNSFQHFAILPHLWDNALQDDVKLSALGYASYGLTILLNPQHRNLAIMLPDVYSSYRFFVNGQLLAANGVPDTSKANYKPHWGPNTVVMPMADTLQLILQIANFSHSKGGISQNLIIGDSKYLLRDHERTVASDFLLSGCLFMGGLFFFGLYLFGTKDKATFFFSLFCMIYSYRMVGSGIYALHEMLPNINWEISTRLEYISLFGSIWLFLQYVRNLYPDDFHKLFMRLFSYSCAFLTILPLFTSATIFTKTINPFLM